MRNDDRKARVRMAVMTSTRSSRAAASSSLSSAPWASNTASMSGTSPSGVLSISLRNAHATGIF